MDFEPGPLASSRSSKLTPLFEEIIGGGLFCGSGITQIAKQVYLAFWPGTSIGQTVQSLCEAPIACIHSLCNALLFNLSGVPGCRTCGLGWITSN